LTYSPNSSSKKAKIANFEVEDETCRRRKIRKKLSKSCQKTFKKLSKLSKKMSKSYQKLSKSCQKLSKSCQKFFKKAKIANFELEDETCGRRRKMSKICQKFVKKVQKAQLAKLPHSIQSETGSKLMTATPYTHVPARVAFDNQ
jgi:hypothetical protein